MIPLKNLNPLNSFPGVTVALIIVNFLVFFFQLSLDQHTAELFILHYGVVPRQLQFALAGSMASPSLMR